MFTLLVLQWCAMETDDRKEGHEMSNRFSIAATSSLTEPTVRHPPVLIAAARVGTELVCRFDGEREMLLPILIQNGGSARAIVVKRVADI